MDPDAIEEKIKQVAELLGGSKVIIAFSGGVDSTVLAYLSNKFAAETLLVMQTGLSVSENEETLAQKQAIQLGIPIEYVNYNEIELSKEYAKNPSNRCYYCKDILHSALEEIRTSRNYDVVASGLNYTDITAHRPGVQAIKEYNVISPLLEAKLTKTEIRWIAQGAGLSAWDKPAMACLASRFKTGVEITEYGMKRIATAEQYLRDEFNLAILRVRDDGNDHARIEVGQSEISKLESSATISHIQNHFSNLGFKSTEIDSEGYRSYVPDSH